MGMFLGNINPTSLLVGDKIVAKILREENVVWEDRPPLNPDTLCFTAEEAGSTIKMARYYSAPKVYLETSTTGKNGSWSDFIVHTSLTSTDGTIITLPKVGDKVYFRAKQDNESFSKISDFNQFVMTGKIAASGNINTLLKTDGSVLNLTGRDYCFKNMFRDCTALTQAPELPAKSLNMNCYQYMFYGCTSLTQAPALPATTLAKNCYCGMFYGCTSLTQAPALPAKSLYMNCYQDMFNGCSSLTQAPALPATRLFNYCYYCMFLGCSSLTQAPALRVTNLPTAGISGMFNKTSIPSYTVDMTACTSVPSLSSAGYFGTYMPYTVLVPAALYDEWIQATNWSTITSNIQAV